MKRTFAIVLTTVFLILAVGCSVYRSHYSAIGLASSNTPRSGWMSFHSFKGVRTFSLSNRNGGVLICSASLDSGSAKVYYDDDGSKDLLFSINAGETVDLTVDNLRTGRVHVIVETEGKATDGSFKFEISDR